MTKNNSALFFACSLIEYIGRKQKIKRSEVVNALGADTIRRIYKYADVLHCEPIEKTADEYVSMKNIMQGTFDNVKNCIYEAPDYWTIGEVYERLIEDISTEIESEDDILVADKLIEVYSSWISDVISNYNSDFFYQSRDYIAECYKAGEIL